MNEIFKFAPTRSKVITAMGKEDQCFLPLITISFVHKNAVIKRCDPFYAYNNDLPLCWQEVPLN